MEIIECEWEDVKPRKLKLHHVVNSIILLMLVLYFGSMGAALFIIKLLGG